MHAESPAGFFQKASHAAGEIVGDHGALAKAVTNQIAEVVRFVVEAARSIGLIEIDDAAINIVDGGAGGIPPVGMEQYVAARCAEQGVAAAEQVDAGVKLGHAALVLGLDEGEVVDTGGTEAAHGLNAAERTEPVDCEEGFVRADTHDAAAGELAEVEGVVGADGRIAVAGADKADGADGVGGKVFAQSAVKREERRLHGFHEEAVVFAGGGGEDLVQLEEVEGSRFFAEDVLAGGEGGEDQVGVAVGVGGDVDGVDVGGKKSFEGWGDGRHGEFLGEGSSAFGVAAPDCGKGGVIDGFEAAGETSGGAAGADDSEADELGWHGIRVARIQRS